MRGNWLDAAAIVVATGTVDSTVKVIDAVAGLVTAFGSLAGLLAAGAAVVTLFRRHVRRPPPPPPPSPNSGSGGSGP